MQFNNNQYLKRKENLVILLLILFSATVRIPVILIYGDAHLENEWGILVNNLINHGTLALKNFNGFLLPNLWMPPLICLLYLFFFIFELRKSKFYIINSYHHKFY